MLLNNLDNVVGGFWGLDIIVSIISVVGCAVVGHNRKEPVKDIRESEFVVIPLNDKEKK